MPEPAAERDHKPQRPKLYRGRADRKDYARLRSQQHKAAAISGVDVVYFDRPGDSVEGYLSGPYCQPGPTASHYRIEREVYVVEIKNHKLLGEIIRCRDLVGEYVRIVYRGRVIARPGDRHGNTCKSYYVYAIPRQPIITAGGDTDTEQIEIDPALQGVEHSKRHLALVPWNYPYIAPETRTQIADGSNMTPSPQRPAVVRFLSRPALLEGNEYEQRNTS